MRISAKAEYACVALVELASRHQRALPTSLKVIAESYGISQAFLLQIFLQLKGAGLVTSVRGAGGGYQLARNPDRIRLSDVVAVIDGPPTLTWALSALENASIVHCLKQVWVNIQTAEQRILDDITLQDLLLQSLQSEALSYQI